MTSTRAGLLLTINVGSSSLKSAIFDREAGVDRGPMLTLAVENLEALGVQLRDRGLLAGIDAVCHRVVHGGPRFVAPVLVDLSVLEALRALQMLAPHHLPAEIAAIEWAERSFPGRPQVACFDTAFHRSLPPVAQRFPLPRELGEMGIIRYGFHGLSCESVLRTLTREAGESASRGRVIVAHLGHGASMTAIRDGRSVETTMGFTPIGGLVMSTRTGDLDPGVLLHLLQERGMTPAQLREAVSVRGGLLGVSGQSAEMRDLLREESRSTDAAMAIEMFCYHARRAVGSLAAVLGGIDTLVFTGGIGERAPTVRRRICAGLEFLGISLEDGRNSAGAGIISTEGAGVTVRVVAADEESMLAYHAERLLDRG